MSETEEAMGATVGRCKVESVSLSGCAWVERISLQCLPHRNIYFTALGGGTTKQNQKITSKFSAADGFSPYAVLLFCRWILL